MSWAVVPGLVVAVLCLGLLISGWVVSVRPDLARVGIEGECLVVRPLGLAAWLAFRRELRFQRSEILRVTAVDRNDLPARRARLLGTGMGVLQAGTFSLANRAGTSFWLTGRARRMLVIDLGSGSMNLLVLQVRDPDRQAASLRAGG